MDTHDSEIAPDEYEVLRFVDICYGDPTECGERGLKFKVMLIYPSHNIYLWLAEAFSFILQSEKKNKSLLSRYWGGFVEGYVSLLFCSSNTLHTHTHTHTSPPFSAESSV